MRHGVFFFLLFFVGVERRVCWGHTEETAIESHLSVRERQKRAGKGWGGVQNEVTTSEKGSRLKIQRNRAGCREHRQNADTKRGKGMAGRKKRSQGGERTRTGGQGVEKRGTGPKTMGSGSRAAARGVKGRRGRVRNCTDAVLGFSFSAVLQQYLRHLVMTVKAGLVQWSPAILWDDTSA